MTKIETLQITTPTDREIVMTRVFDAPRRLVFEAFTKPELLKRWLLGPDGWSLVVCDIVVLPSRSAKVTVPTASPGYQASSNSSVETMRSGATISR